MTRRNELAKIAVVKCCDYDEAKLGEALARQFDLLGGLEKFIKPGETVLIKPNLIAPKPRKQATQTDPAVILVLARLLKDFGARPFVGDSPAWGDVFSCAKILELDEPLRKLGVPLRQLDRPKQCFIPEAHTHMGISSVALEADKIINLPKFKSHQQLGATFAVKNMFGTVSGKAKAYWHFRRGSNEKKFCKMLIGIYRYLKPVITIVDGITVMEGIGPIRGNPRPLGFLIAGQDPIACEIVCAKLIDTIPEDLPMIRTAKLISFGTSDSENIEVVGDDFSSGICRDFKHPELIPIRFSLLRVCGSTVKQLLKKLFR